MVFYTLIRIYIADISKTILQSSYLVNTLHSSLCLGSRHISIDIVSNVSEGNCKTLQRFFINNFNEFFNEKDTYNDYVYSSSATFLITDL